MKQVKKNPSRLRPFDQQDRDYFEENKPTTFDECIETIEEQIHMIKIHSRTVENVTKERGVLSSNSTATIARIVRISVRDLKVYVNQFMEHLEQVEMKGEWK